MIARILIVAAAVSAWNVSAFDSAAQAREATETAAIDTVVATDYRTAWDTLVAELDEGDFTINATIEENSTIRVLLQSQTPSTWVDCGSITVNSKHEVFGDRRYDFLAANSVRYLVADETVDELVDVERRTALNALASIKLAPVPGGTSVKVDAIYVMKFRTREFGRNITPRSLDSSLNFDSGGQASTSEEIRLGAATETVPIECRPTGELERRVVSVLERPQLLAAKRDDRGFADARLATASLTSPPQPVSPAPRPTKQTSPAARPVPKKLSPTPVASPVALFTAKDRPAPAAKSGWRVQLSALASQSAAEKAWRRLKPANSDLLSVLSLHVQKVELSKGTFFRVQAGPLADQLAAASLCNKLKKRNQDCLVVAP